MPSWSLSPGPLLICNRKKYQIEQKVIIVSIESWMEIGPWFWLIWIAPWLFLISVIFRGYIEVRVGPKTQILGASCLCLKSSFSRGFKRHLYNDEGYLCSKFQLNLTFLTGVIAPHRAPPSPPVEWSQLGPEPR